MSGSFDVVLDDGRDQRRFHLGLLLRPLRLPDFVSSLYFVSFFCCV